jgi:hypothetical protein
MPEVLGQSQPLPLLFKGLLEQSLQLNYCRLCACVSLCVCLMLHSSGVLSVVLVYLECFDGIDHIRDHHLRVRVVKQIQIIIFQAYVSVFSTYKIKKAISGTLICAQVIRNKTKQVKFALLLICWCGYKQSWIHERAAFR